MESVLGGFSIALGIIYLLIIVLAWNSHDPEIHRLKAAIALIIMILAIALGNTFSIVAWAICFVLGTLQYIAYSISSDQEDLASEDPQEDDLECNHCGQGKNECCPHCGAPLAKR